MAHVPGSDVGLVIFSFQHLSLFQVDGPFSDVTTRQNYKITML